jgi:hypothetical protein
MPVFSAFDSICRFAWENAAIWMKEAVFSCFEDSSGSRVIPSYYVQVLAQN